ncbi:MAG: hypothetical protein VX965_01375, partial [Candidatus Thermoplasmatota archaeon]|nr:hypothetical protein [Candidatus Thermoplasmatota archaeon]
MPVWRVGDMIRNKRWPCGARGDPFRLGDHVGHGDAAETPTRPSEARGIDGQGRHVAWRIRG